MSAAAASAPALCVVEGAPPASCRRGTSCMIDRTIVHLSSRRHSPSGSLQIDDEGVTEVEPAGVTQCDAENVGFGADSTPSA